MKVLVVGSDGYLGCLLVQQLAEMGCRVIGLDTGFYSERSLFPHETSQTEAVQQDIRNLGADALEGAAAVVHLGELSNDPAGQLAPDITRDINHGGSLRLARLAKAAGCPRFVYTSSCSVYGVADRDVVDEESAVNPQTTYAQCKTWVERDVGALASPSFSPTFLRNATAFGASPRMRFDIVLNNLAGLAWTTSQIRLTSDGTPWRPLVHALDICQAILEVLKAPRDTIHNQIFNVGSTEQNYQIREIATLVADEFPGCSLTCGPASSDNRSYRVSFEKIRKHLPNFKCQWDAGRGARQLHELFQRIQLTREMFEHRCFTRLKQLEHLLKTEQIDAHFYWR